MKTINTKDMLTTYEEIRRLQDDARRDAAHAGDNPTSIYARRCAEDARKAAVKAGELQLVLREQIAPLADAIKAAEDRARERTITAEQVLEALHKVNQRFCWATKKAMEGLQIDVDLNVQDFPRSYKYTPISTHFCAEYTRGSWRIPADMIQRTECRKAGEGIRIYMPEDLKTALVKEYSRL